MAVAVIEQDQAETMTEAAARRLTAKIRNKGSELAELVLQAQQGRAWAALGYGSWERYVDAEFKMSAGNAYRLVRQAELVNEIAQALPAVQAREIASAVSARQAAVIRPDMPTAAAEIAAAINAGAEPATAVREAVARRQSVPAPRGRVLAVDSTEVDDGESEAEPVDLLAVATDLRDDLRGAFAEITAALRTAPKPRDEAREEADLWEEMAAWLGCVSRLTSAGMLDRLYELQADLYRVMLRLHGAGAKAEIAAMIGLTKEAIDYLRKAKASAFEGL